MVKFAKQIEFDAIVKDCLDEGDSLEEASNNALEVFADDYDVSYLFVCRDEQSWKLKTECQKNVHTIVQASKQKQTFLNASFCMQGLRQAVNSSSSDERGPLRLCESASLLNVVLLLLLVDDEDEESEDEDEELCDINNDVLMNHNTALKFVLFLLSNSSSMVDATTTCAVTVEGVLLLIDSIVRLMNLLKSPEPAYNMEYVAALLVSWCDTWFGLSDIEENLTVEVILSDCPIVKCADSTKNAGNVFVESMAISVSAQPVTGVMTTVLTELVSILTTIDSPKLKNPLHKVQQLLQRISS